MGISLRSGHIFLFFFWSFLAFSTSANSTNIDESVWTAFGFDSDIKLTADMDSDSVLLSLQRLNQLAKQSTDTVKIVESLMKLGVWHYLYGDLGSSSRFYSHALGHLREKSSDYMMLAWAHYNIGWNLARQGEYISALESYHMALSYQEKIDNDKLLRIIYHSISMLHQLSEDYQLALHYQLLVLDIGKMIGDTTAVINSYSNLGELYGSMKDHKSSFHFISMALKLNYIIDNKRGVIENLNDLAVLLQEQGDCRRALDSLKIANAYSLSENDPNGQMTTCYNLYLAYKCLEDDENALNCYIGYNRIADSLQSLQYDNDILQAFGKQQASHFKQENELLRQSFEKKASELTSAKNWIYLLLVLGTISISLIFVLRRLIAKKRSRNESLERIISLRTQELSEKNERLEELIFMNAHNLRAPLSRILMIFNVLDSGIQILEIDTMATIKDSAEEMDRTIHQIIDHLSSHDLRDDIGGK